MQRIGGLVTQRVDQIIVENEMMRAGFAAFPYQVMRAKGLSTGARLTYAFLLMYAWQEGSCFAGQEKLAEDMGVGRAQIQRYIYELRDTTYIEVERKDKRYNNTYIILDRKKPFKLKKGKEKIVENVA